MRRMKVEPFVEGYGYKIGIKRDGYKATIVVELNKNMLKGNYFGKNKLELLIPRILANFKLAIKEVMSNDE